MNLVPASSGCLDEFYQDILLSMGYVEEQGLHVSIFPCYFSDISSSIMFFKFELF